MELQRLWESALGIGLEGKDLGTGQMALRAVLIYVVTLAIIRIAKKRFLGRASAFDVVVGIIVGSIASRAITGNAPLLPAMAASAVIVLMHWLFSAMALRSHRFGGLIKGSSTLLVEDGRVLEDKLRAAHMSHRDLEEALREQGLTGTETIAEARLERDGSVSVIKR